MKSTVYTIVSSFFPADGEKWTSYTSWRGMEFERFDSIDSLMRPTLYDHPDDEGWGHVTEYSLQYIADLDYAIRKHQEIGKGEIVGVRFEDHDPSQESFLGFDLIDVGCDISLLTNWGNDVAMINEALASNALIRDQNVIDQIHQTLLRDWSWEPHVEKSRVVSIYDVDTPHEAFFGNVACGSCCVIS